MSDQQAQPQGPPPGPPVSPMAAAPTLDEVHASLLHAVDQAARSSGGATDIREVREYGAAALAFAQAYVILHPKLVAPQGVTPEQIAASIPTPPPAKPAQPAQGGAKP